MKRCDFAGRNRSINTRDMQRTNKHVVIINSFCQAINNTGIICNFNIRCSAALVMAVCAFHTRIRIWIENVQEFIWTSTTDEPPVWNARWLEIESTKYNNNNNRYCVCCVLAMAHNMYEVCLCWWANFCLWRFCFPQCKAVFAIFSLAFVSQHFYGIFLVSFRKWIVFIFTWLSLRFLSQNVNIFRSYTCNLHRM